MPRGHDFAGSLIVAPPSAAGSTWLRRFGDVSTGFASGWMRIRGARRRRALDRGFVLSDHVDWPALLAADRGDRRRARLGDARLARAAGALADGARHRRASRSRATGKGEEDTDPVEVAGEEIAGVKRFARLFAALDETTRTNEKVEAMVGVLSPTPIPPTRRGRCTS